MAYEAKFNSRAMELTVTEVDDDCTMGEQCWKTPKTFVAKTRKGAVNGLKRVIRTEMEGYLKSARRLQEQLDAIDDEENGVELDRITTEVQTRFIGSDFLGFEGTREELEKIVGDRCECYDSGIDDGVDCDEPEDQYVMYASYRFAKKRLYVKFYYGDVTEEIGYVDVSEN